MSIEEYRPPKLAFISHEMDNGVEVKVVCAVESYDSDIPQFGYWVSYVDPEDDESVIADSADASELEFIDDSTGVRK